MPDWNEIKSKVEQNGNVATFSMEDLREAIGAGKLGVKVRSDISSALRGIGLGHIPEELPSYQHESVRLYKYGTAIGDFIATVLTPGQQNDIKLAEQFSETGTDYAKIVEKVRELVSE